MADSVAAAQWAAVAVALIAAVVVAVQSWETRKAAQAARDAVDVANRSLDVSNRSLDVSRQMASEQLRARIDAQMPRLSVTLAAWTAGSFEEASDMAGQRAPVEAGRTFRLPRDAWHLLFLDGVASVHNDSDGHVDVQIEHLPRRGLPVSEHVTLAPHTTLPVPFAACRSIEGWIEGATAYPVSGGHQMSALVNVAYHSPADQGASEVWNLQVDGSPLVQVENEQGAWTLASGSSPRTWCSRSA
jgi:hypothetical protein